MSELPYPSGRHGGVLSAAEITRLIEDLDPEVRPEPFALIEGWDRKYLRDASYDVRIATDGLVLPSGETIPASDDLGVQLKESLVLAPGDSAWLSTQERFCLPSSIAGTVTLKSDLASQGLFLLSGTLIAPRYGQLQSESSSDSRLDRRLHFFVANFGSQAILLQPADTAIASVQFLTVVGDLWRPSEHDDQTLPQAKAPRRPAATLGFLQSLKHIEGKYDVLEATTARNRDLMRNLIIVGYFVLGTAVISASLATILTVTSNENLIHSIKQAAPHTAAGRVLLATIVVSVAWIIFSGAVVAGPGSEASRALPLDMRRQRDTAIRNLRSEMRARLVAKSAGAGFVLAALAYGIYAVGGGALWLVEIGAFSVVVWLGGWAVHESQRPLSRSEIEREMVRLVKIDDGTWKDPSAVGHLVRGVRRRSPGGGET
jgi:deoxycytidine triphosphate deaminase